MENIINDLKWRYATKEFDPTKKLTDQQVNDLIESLQLSASSFGLQPWKFVVVTNPALREALVPVSWNQRQVADASHLIILCRPLTITDKDVDKLIDATTLARKDDPKSLEGYANMMKGFLSKMDDAAKAEWMKNQIYIALGNLLTVAGTMKIDSCPMEGFSATDYDKILGLTEMGLSSVVLCPVGYRSNNDKYQHLKKVRYPIEELRVDIK